jgi:hypothetical protein
MHQANLLQAIFFVPSQTNGTMLYELYYQHLHKHHAHITNLCSLAIINFGNIKKEIMVLTRME